MTDLTLYSYFRSSTSYRVRIALNLKGIPFKYNAVHLLKDGGEQHKTEYRKVNPIGGVPSIAMGDFVLGESLAILEFLDENYSNCPLYPKDSKQKAIVRQMCEIVNSDLHPLTNLRVLQYLEKRGFDQNAKDEWSHHWLKIGLEAFQKMVVKHGGKFCFGDQVTAADLCLIPHLFTARRFNLDLSPFDRLLKIEETCLAIDGFKKAHPFSQPDTPDEFKTKT